MPLNAQIGRAAHAGRRKCLESRPVRSVAQIGAVLQTMQGGCVWACDPMTGAGAGATFCNVLKHPLKAK
jgi:hypothetical protein